jgi:hypothetical protein
MSYEQALNSNNNEITMGAKSGPDLTDGQINGAGRIAPAINGCGTPADTKVQVRVAIKNGRTMGVTVITTPPNSGVAACIDGRVRGIGWPSSSKMDSFTASF